MNTITLTIEATPENLRKLADAFSDTAAPMNVKTTPAKVEAKPEPQITLSMIRTKGKEFTLQGREKELADVFKEFGATKLSQIDEADYPKVYERLQEALG